MENPYSHSPSPGSMTPEQEQIADYELAIGKNIDYYLPKFQAFDSGGSKQSWNWPAFFVTTPWFLYRKMWLWGMLNLVVPWVAAIVLSVVALAIRSEALQGIFMLAAFVVPWLLLTIYANALYWRHIKHVIRDVPQSFADKPDKRARRIERNGGTGLGAMIGVMFGVLFFGGGILAAIAIPAYQDYTIRAQVSEGLMLSAGAKAAVAEYYAQNDRWPADGDAAGFSGVSGKYVESIKVENGSVVIHYGGAANRNLANKTVILLPGATTSKGIIWMCANASSPDVVEKAPGPNGTDVPTKYLPRQCRPS